MAEQSWKTGLIEIADGVYAYIQEKGTWFVSNAGLIVGKEYAIVIDSLANSKMTTRFIEEIRKITDKPIRFLINTHHHTDHTWTNYMFEGAISICHVRCREMTVNEMKLDPKMYQMLFPGLDITGAKVTPQDVVFEKEFRIYQDNREIRVIHPGVAHTVGDAFVYLPDEKVVFCGDLLFAEPCTPFVLMGSISGSIQALDMLASLDADIYVPGHGPISERNALYKARDYLVFVRDEARKRFKQGMNAFDAAKDIDLGEYRSWSEWERIVGNVERAYSEFRGEPPGAPLPNLIEIVRRMMELRKSAESK
ncbi:MAG: MBL fold metallo-hydrolase [Candidatus Baldrarchaeia archaeon]